MTAATAEITRARRPRLAIAERARRGLRSGALPGAIIAILLVAALAPAAMHVSGLFVEQDEGATVLYPGLVLHGAVVHRDFQSFYGPGFNWLVAAAYIVAGPSQAVERVVGLGLIAVLGVMVVALAARVAGRPAALLASALVLPLVWTFPLGLPWLGGVDLCVGSILLLATCARPSQGPTRLACAGALAALALSFRPDMAPAIAVSALPFLLASRTPRWWYAGGALVGLTPLAVHAAVVTPGTLFRELVVDAQRAAGGRVLPIPPTDTPGRLAFAVAMASLALAVGAALLSRRRGIVGMNRRVMFSVALLSLGCLLQALQRDEPVHTLTAEIVAIGWVPVSLWVVLPRRLVRDRRALAAGLALLLIAASLVGVRVSSMAGVAVTSQGRSFLLPAAVAADTQALLDRVNRIARPGQRLVVAPLDMRRTNYGEIFLYFLLPQLQLGTHYLEMEPNNANRADSGFAADVASAGILVLTSSWDSWNEPNQSAALGSPAPNEVVASQFCNRASIGPYRVLTRC